MIPLLVYFSSVSGMTENFIKRVELPSFRIPIKYPDDGVLVTEPFILVTPSYGAGRNESTVPRQVIKFLNDERNRANIVGVAGGGSLNYFDKFCRAPKIISAKCKVPLIFTYELLGLPEDVKDFRNLVINFNKETELHTT